MPLLGAGDLIDRSVFLYHTNVKTILRMLLVALVVNVGAGFAQVYTESHFAQNSTIEMATLIGTTLAVLLAQTFTMVIIARSTASAVTQGVVGVPPTWKAAFSKFPGTFLVTFITSFAVAFGTAALFIPGILFWVWLGFAPVFVALGLAPWRQSFLESRALSVGRFFAILWRLGAPATFFGLFSIVLGLLPPLLVQGIALHTWSIDLVFANAPLWEILLASGLRDVLQTLILPLPTVAITLLLLNLLDEKRHATTTQPAS